MDDKTTSGLEQHDGESPRGGRTRRAGASVRRNWPLLAGAAALVVASSAGGAVAGGLITSSKIDDFTIKSRDIADNAVNARLIKPGSVQSADLTVAAREALQGQPGAPGSRWLTGAGAPGNLAANDGDWYFDTATQGLYTRVGGAWGFVVTLGGVEGDAGPAGPAGAPGAAGASGAPGAPGPAGAAGADGKDGANGKPGSAWLNGTGAPSAEIGLVGDWYLDSSTADAFQKTGAAVWTKRVNLQGIQGEKGATGAAGTNGTNGTNGEDGLDGATWLVGTAEPVSTLGKDTDLYLHTTTSDVYRKASGAWALLTNIKGQQGVPGTNGAAGANGTNGIDGTNGAAGATWLTGAGAPDATIGKDTDLYLNTTNGDVYKKTAGAWGTTPIANLTGPAGADGSGGSGGGTTWSSGAGAPNPGTVNPAAGAFYLNTTNGAIYKADGTAWTAIYTPPAASGSAVLALQATKTSGSQVLPRATGTNTTGDKVTFNNVVGSNSALGAYDTSTSVFTVAQAGFYFVQAATRAVDQSPVTSTVNQNLYVSINGGDALALSSYHTDYTAANNANYPSGVKGKGYTSSAYYLNAGDTISVFGYSSNSSTEGTALKTDGSCQLLIIKM